MEKTLGKTNATWQTKATLKLFDTYKVGDEPKFGKVNIKEGWMGLHHVCPKCNKFVDAEIEIENGRLSNSVRYRLMK